MNTYKGKFEEKKTSLGNAIIIGAVLCIAGFALGLILPKWLPYLGGNSDIDWNTQLDPVYDMLRLHYDGEISKEDIIEGAKKGLTAAIGDEYTVYMDAETTQEFQNSLHGTIDSAGVGIEMGLRDNYVRVLRTLPDNPARKAGILAGDIIYKIDGEEVYALSVEEIANKIRGEQGTEVTVTVVRNGKELSFTMVREKINNTSVDFTYEGQTAIIKVTRFDDDTGTLVQKEVQNHFAEHDVNKVILDLRDNGGGYVAAARDLLSLWIDGDTILIQRSKNQADTHTRASVGRAALADIKTVVLVNGASASASEIVAGALQDYGKATILGEKTYGKGVVQELFNMSGNALLKITTTSWYTPLDRSINKTGIEPDIVVERSYDDINNMVDPQLDAARKL